MSNYYLLSGKNSSKVASAFAPEGTKLAHELIDELENVRGLPFEFKLVKLIIEENGLAVSGGLSDLQSIWLDYQPNSLAWPLFSHRLKSVIESKLTGEEGIDWISAIVNSTDEKRVYYIPRFSHVLDVLNIEETIFIQGSNRVIKPVFSRLKISEYSIFHRPSANSLWRITSGLYVNEATKKEIQKQKLSGISFEKTSVV